MKEIILYCDQLKSRYTHTNHLLKIKFSFYYTHKSLANNIDIMMNTFGDIFTRNHLTVNIDQMVMHNHQPKILHFSMSIIRF